MPQWEGMAADFCQHIIGQHQLNPTTVGEHTVGHACATAGPHVAQAVCEAVREPITGRLNGATGVGVSCGEPTGTGRDRARCKWARSQ